VIDYGDNAGYLVAATVTNGSPTQQTLTGPFALPVGTWFTLQVRQLLGSGSAAFSDVYLNGQLVAASRAPTFSGTQIGHVSYGIVELTPDAALGPVSLDFDQVTAAGFTGYIDPLGGDRYIAGRTDMGIDFCLTPGEPVRAMPDGIVVGISPDWFRHQPYIWYQVLDGPYAGRYVYVAEQIKRLAHVGAQLSAGQPLAYYKKSGTCLENRLERRRRVHPGPGHHGLHRGPGHPVRRLVRPLPPLSSYRQRRRRSKGRRRLPQPSRARIPLVVPGPRRAGLFQAPPRWPLGPRATALGQRSYGLLAPAPRAGQAMGTTRTGRGHAGRVARPA